MKSWYRGGQVVVILLGLWLGFDRLAHVVAENLWFEEVGYAPVFWQRLMTQGGIGAIVSLLSAGFLLGNLGLARWLMAGRSPGWVGRRDELSQRVEFPRRDEKWPRRDESTSLRVVGQRGKLALRFGEFLGVLVALALGTGLLVLYYGQAVVQQWRGEGLPSLPIGFLPTLGQWLTQLVALGAGREAGLAIAGLVGGIAMVLRYPQLLWGLAIALSLGWGYLLAGHWSSVLPVFSATAFQEVDPLFQRDIGQYIFGLPIAELLLFWLSGLCGFAGLAVSLTYLLAHNGLSEGVFLGFSRSQQRHLLGLASGFMLVIAVSNWLDRYELLYSSRGVTYGASFTDVTVQLPALTILSITALLIAFSLGWRALDCRGSDRDVAWAEAKSIRCHRRGWNWLLAEGVAYGVVLVLAYLLPLAIQKLVVQPTELDKERPYIQRSIAQTRAAFNLDQIEVKTFQPQNSLTRAQLIQNEPTIRNIRLWDTRPLLQTNRQLQQIRPYYKFAGADVDRYPLTAPPASAQQVIIAARELDYQAVPPAAQTWVNEHLVYTHGYGFTLSPVNQVAVGGLPDYWVKDIGTDGQSSALNLANEQVRASIPIDNPRLYFGELTDTNIFTGTRVKELDYPSGNENVYTVYEGQGGIALTSPWRRVLLAKFLNDWQMLLSRDFTPTTRLLWRRNIHQRLRAIAPFLRYDQDPYLVAADGGVADVLGVPPKHPGSLFWIVDAYTTSDRYPYADPGKADFNYIRNSVKVVIDAYNGTVQFYIADLDDPIIQTWSKVFPTLFQPLNTMPSALQQHLRYPIDLFKIQSAQLMVYHMTDPQVFYNREDLWQVPNEIYGNQPQRVEPYYLIMRLPTAKQEEFVLLLPYTPNQRTNLIAWLAARSDGNHYGKLLLYTFPKQELVFGPEQIEARINQDPIISQQISLWNRAGSRVVQGNLLVIPIAQSLLYVEPLYLEAEQNSLPTLVRVVVAYANQIVMAETLNQALDTIFPSKSPPRPPSLRPVP